MRRAQSMGINVVIVAAIALLVLVIIALIVSNGGRSLSEGTNSCVANGGRCSDGMDLGPEYEEIGTYDCTDGEQCWAYQYGR